jgi:hypothetical protein
MSRHAFTRLALCGVHSGRQSMAPVESYAIGGMRQSGNIGSRSDQPAQRLVFFSFRMSVFSDR